MSDFHDKLADLWAAEVAVALREATGDRFAEMICALGALLGRTIGAAAHGDAQHMDTLLTGLDRLVAEEAAGVAGLISLAKLHAAAAGEAGRS